MHRDRENHIAMPLEPETKQLHPYKEDTLYNTEKVKLNRIYSFPPPWVNSKGTIKSTINNLWMPELTIVQDSQAFQNQNIWNSSVSLEESGESSCLTCDCLFFEISLLHCCSNHFSTLSQPCNHRQLFDSCRHLPTCPLPNLHKHKWILQRLIKNSINFPALLVT